MIPEDGDAGDPKAPRLTDLPGDRSPIPAPSLRLTFVNLQDLFPAKVMGQKTDPTWTPQPLRQSWSAPEGIQESRGRSGTEELPGD